MFTQPTQIPRSPLASVLTLLVHVCLALVVVAMSAVPRVLPEIADRPSLMYVAAAPPPILTFELPPPPVPEPVPPLEVRLPEPPVVPEAAGDPIVEDPIVEDPIVEEPVVEEPIVSKPPITMPEPLPDARDDTPEPPPVPAAPPVVLGAFGDMPAAVRGTPRQIALEDAGFSAEEDEAERTRRRLALVEGFDAILRQTDTPRRPAPVTETGFAADTSRSATAGTRAAVEDTGFTAEAAAGVPAAPRTPARAAGFDETAAAARPGTPVAPRPRRDTPVEILHKPTPAYTDEARARGIEGEVSIEVEFTAAGAVRVLRTVRGLGYGLDRMARRAAEQIQFTPATRDGVPVDFRTTLTIVFRLT